MQIAIAAKRVGPSSDAIRFYERTALLPRLPRTLDGFRQYGESDIETVAFTFDDTKTNIDSIVKATSDAAYPSEVEQVPN